MKYLNCLLSAFFITVCCSLFTVVNATNFQLMVAEPTLYLPIIGDPFESREAKITPEEYPLAQQLRHLLTQLKYQEALTVLNEYKIQSDVLSPAMYLLIAQIQMQLTQFDHAEKNYIAALKIMPDLVRAHEGLSIVYISLKQPKKAQKSLIKAISLGANNAQSYAQLAYLNMKLNSPLSAIYAYQQALMLDPGNANIRNGLLYALTRSKQFEAAASLLEQMLIENSTKADLWIQRANLALETKDNAKALSSIEVAIRLGNKKTETYQLAAQIHLTEKNYSRAVTLLNSLINTNQLSMNSFNKLLPWLLKEEQWSHAEKLITAMNLNVDVKKSSQYTSDDKSRLLHYQGVLAESKNNKLRAESFFKKAIQLDPSNGDSLISLARVSTELNNVAHAELLYQRAERFDEVKLSAMLGRAQIYIDQQQYEQALQLLRQTRKAFPQRHDLDVNIHTLASIVNNKA
ncbi:MAG: tetratricopeptide repeat protein [Colwellia sp.]|nr:tetratricopeptide repeat protein [Colwellia sp.]